MKILFNSSPVLGFLAIPESTTATRRKWWFAHGAAGALAPLPGEYTSFVTITLTGLKNPSEVRVFESGTTTEVAGTGAENVTSGSHSFSIGLGQPVDIAILSLGYQNIRLLSYSSAVSASVPVQQALDRQYENP